MKAAHLPFKPGLVFILTVALSILIGTVPGEAQEKQLSVMDYYLTLPEEYFSCEMPINVTRQYRLKQIIKKNIRNGYIQAKYEGFKMQVALFTAPGKQDIIGVNVPCGAGCMCNKFAMLTRSASGKWEDVTSEMFPSDEEILKFVGKPGADIILQYDLPEFGLDIKVIDDMTRKVICKITWSGGKFKLKKQL